MKKVYLSALAMIGAISAFGQVTTTATHKVDYTTVMPDRADERPLGATERAAGDIIWEDGFETPSDWTAAGPGTPPENGWSIGTTTNGWYFGTGDDMGTTGNFARFSNSDGTAADVGVVEDGPFTLTYNSSIDLSGVCSPQLEFEQYGARFIVVQAVEVSTDGGTTWVQAGSNDDIDPLTAAGGSVYDQPETRRFSITDAIAGDPSNVMIRLFWDGAVNGPSMNYIDYGWFVDNMRVVEGYEYDHEIQAGYFRSGVGVSFAEGLEYYKVSQDQLTNITFSAEACNQGCLDHTNSQATFDVSFGGSSVFTGTSAATTLGGVSCDSVGATTDYTPADLGTYTITYSFAGDNPEGITTNDELTDEFEVTEYLYGRHNGNQTGAFTNWSGNAGLPASIGNDMDIFADGVIGAVDIYLDDNTEDGALIYVAIYKFDGTEYLYEAQSDDYEVVSSDIGSTKTIYFENDVIVNAGELILVVAGHYGSPEASFGMAQPTVFGSVSGSSSDGSIFTLIDPEAIMIDVHMRSYIGLEENVAETFTVGQNVPNPFTNTSVINYSLETASNVTVEIVDITGKVVKVINQGEQAAGSYQITLDANEFAEGTYFYTFTIGAEKVTKRMVITK